ncbi:hypothetical protein MRX96_014266 [Rhipicephalus microplus]
MWQKENQPIDDFIAELQRQAAMCNFGDKHDHLLGDRIIVGVPYAAPRESLLHNYDLTLEKIVATWIAADISKQHASSLATTSNGQEGNCGQREQKKAASVETKSQPTVKTTTVKAMKAKLTTYLVASQVNRKGDPGPCGVITSQRRTDPVVETRGLPRDQKEARLRPCTALDSGERRPSPLTSGSATVGSRLS